MEVSTGRGAQPLATFHFLKQHDKMMRFDGASDVCFSIMCDLLYV